VTAPERTAPVPTRIAAPKTQNAVCACGNTFAQTWFEGFPNQGGPDGRWLPPTCGQCRGDKAKEAEDADRSAKEAEAAQRQAARLKALETPKLYASVTLDSFVFHGEEDDKRRQLRALQIARRYLTFWPKVEPVLVFSGKWGTGKGHIAWAIARGITEAHDVTVRVVKLGHLIRDLRESWRDQAGPTERERLRAYRSPDLLVIDEVSRHAFYGQPTQHLYDVVDDRIEWCRPTILTTNEDDAGLQQLLGGALIDRIQGNGGVVDFGACSWRARVLEGGNQNG
jgi:DNA replication protein DnaC